MVISWILLALLALAFGVLCYMNGYYKGIEVGADAMLAAAIKVLSKNENKDESEQRTGGAAETSGSAPSDRAGSDAGADLQKVD